MGKLVISSHSDSLLEAVDQFLSTDQATPPRTYQPGKVLLTEGAVPDYLLVLLQGSVKLSFVDPNGREYISNIRPAVSIIAGNSAILGSASPIRATALSMCRVRWYSVERIRNALSSAPPFARAITLGLARENLDQTLALKAAVSGTTRERLVDIIRNQYPTGVSGPDSAFSSTIPALKKIEIAKLLGITPEHLSRLLKSLKREGITVPARPKLKAERLPVKSPGYRAYRAGGPSAISDF